MSGKLYIVSTPIGNLQDISSRAISILSDSDLIFCEDTRITRKLLSHFKISNKLSAYNNYNELSRVDSILKLLLSDKNIALVSDAGTPCISDPGYRLVNSAHKNNIEVISIPGPSAVHAALSISGLPSDNYFFQGFLPKKKGRKTKFEYLKTLKSTVIIFESPKRLKRTLNDISYYMENRIISVCKEITKMYEKVYLDKIEEIISTFDDINPKGEYVILIAKEGYQLK